MRFLTWDGFYQIERFDVKNFGKVYIMVNKENPRKIYSAYEIEIFDGYLYLYNNGVSDWIRITRVDKAYLDELKNWVLTN